MPLVGLMKRKLLWRVSLDKWTVVWSVYDEKVFGPTQKYRQFEDRDSAKWFAKEMEKCYNWSICVRSKLLEDL